MRQCELEVISNINTSKKLVEKNAKIKKLFDLDTIRVEEYIDAKTGKRINKYSTIADGDVYYKINKPYTELRDLLINRSIPVLGFMYKSKRYK